MSNDLHTIIIPKIKLLKELDLKKEEICQILIHYPSVMSKSLYSLAKKIRYLKVNFSNQLIFETYFPLILLYSFESYIEPRGNEMD